MIYNELVPIVGKDTFLSDFIGRGIATFSLSKRSIQ
jgi:hypothetical protein